MKDLFDLNGRVVVVTGGLGQLGRQFTQALRRRGARVAVLDRAVEHGAGESDDVMKIPADVTSRKSLTAALETIAEAWETPYGLINNAALDSPPNAPATETRSFETYPEDSWDQVMGVNAKGAFLCCQVFGGAMASAGRGSVVNIASIYGMLSPDQRIYSYRAEAGDPFCKPVAYSVSKAGVLNLTRYLATYWAAKGVRVNSLTPGGVYNGQDQEFLNGYTERVPLGRMAREDEYNGAVIFLLSDASSYMTGSNLIVDGGWSAW